MRDHTLRPNEPASFAAKSNGSGTANNIFVDQEIQLTRNACAGHGYMRADTRNLWENKEMAKHDSFTLRLQQTDNGPDLLFALNPESEERKLLVMIGRQGGTLNTEDATKLLEWLSTHLNKRTAGESGK